jgi:hypothetical protein
MADLKLDVSKCYLRINDPKDNGVPFYLGNFIETKPYAARRHGGNQVSEWKEHTFEKGVVIQFKNSLTNLVSETDCLPKKGGKRNRKMYRKSRKISRKGRRYSRKN